MTPTARTLKALRDDGWQCATVEKWIPRVNIRKDLWGCDVFAVHPFERRFLLVQCTSMSNVGARVKKVQETAGVRGFLQAGGQVEVWGWDGKRLKRVAIEAEAATVVQAPARRRRQDKQATLFED